MIVFATRPHRSAAFSRLSQGSRGRCSYSNRRNRRKPHAAPIVDVQVERVGNKGAAWLALCATCARHAGVAW